MYILWRPGLNEVQEQRLNKEQEQRLNKEHDVKINININDVVCVEILKEDEVCH